MRLYYFTPDEHALENLHKGHLKISFPNEVNDLFEMKPFSFPGIDNAEKRRNRKNWEQNIERSSLAQGFVSLSGNPHSPIMWAHYCNSHKGLCYGFEVDPDSFSRVGYVEHLRELSPFAFTDPATDESIKLLKEEVDYAITTKSLHWAYEEEWRLLCGLNEEAQKTRIENRNSLHFIKFAPNLSLREVIIGAASTRTTAQVQDAVSHFEHSIEIKTFRPAFNAFKMVEQLDPRFQK